MNTTGKISADSLPARLYREMRSCIKSVPFSTARRTICMLLS